MLLCHVTLKDEMIIFQDAVELTLLPRVLKRNSNSIHDLVLYFLLIKQVGNQKWASLLVREKVGKLLQYATKRTLQNTSWVHFDILG